MRRSTLWMCALLAIAASGCKQINEQIAKIKQKISGERPEPARTAPTPPRREPEPAPPPEPTARPAARRARPPESQIPERPQAFRDVPYDSPDTGTIAPGMGEREVYSLWGAPVAVRRQGEFTYLFFRNGCEYTCGTEDVVTLQNGQVVDAVLRWPGHGYSGQSSSPPGTVPVPNLGGDTLTIKRPSTP
ncbi:MAG TPA: hypothetical protein VEK78_12895 [Gemmatimonadales bacterium]|nr:hypothetical protein [Gemmatimonadales bacterium]